MRVACCQPWRSRKPPAARLRPSVGPPSSRNTDAGRSYTDLPFCQTATIAYRSPFIGIGARENRRSMTPMPDTNQRAPITTHGYRCAGKPAIHDAHAGHGPDESDRSSCRVPVVPDESDRPSCRVPVVPDESDRPSCRVPVRVRRVPCGTSPGRCPSCRASPVRERVPVNTRHLPSPGPTYACSRRRQPLCYEHIFACTPWRFMNARSAARLRRIVGPLIIPLASVRSCLLCYNTQRCDPRSGYAR